MKIAILTLPLHTNYGGILQNYALQAILKRMGHEVYTIDCDKSNSSRMTTITKIKNRIRRIICDLFHFYKTKKTKSFIHKHINTTSKSKYKIKHINDVNYLFDVVIVGSDQVWRPSYVYPNIETFFLNFISNPKIRRIAYAASFGTKNKEYNKEQIANCRDLFKLFSAISVREKSGLELIKEYDWKCENNPVLCLDPTFLLQKKEYQSLIGYNEARNDKFFCYILDRTQEKEELIQKISEDIKLPPYILSGSDKILSIEKWIKAFCDAKYIFTDSFHGCVFSIIFNKPFIAFGNISRGVSRFESLLELFDLHNRLLCSTNDYTDKMLKYEFDWRSINNRKNSYVEQSLLFLQNALK